jgi:signal transduction histidine kinase
MNKDETKERAADELTAMHQRIAELERILEITRELTSALTLEPLLKRILATAAELTDSEGASILLWDAPTGELRFLTAFGTSSEDVMEADLPVPVEGSIAGTIFTSREPLIVPDVQVDPRYYREVERQIGYKTRTLLGAPLQIKNRCIGVLEALNKQSDRGFSQKDIKTLVALAAQAAIAIENARLYEAVVGHAERLEERVQERTAELQARNEELDAYAHTVAHDLKSPLAIVIGHAERLATDYASTIDPDVLGYLRKIERVGRKMCNIIDNLLLLAQLREVKVQLGPLDMASVVIEAQQRLADMFEEYQVNYLSNALKYGGRPPCIELGVTQQTDGMVCFWVSDNGPGLTPQEQARLFTPFTSLDQDYAKGHGLGLSIVQRIVEKLGGQVGVESKVGQGSVFTFSLPTVDG